MPSTIYETDSSHCTKVFLKNDIGRTIQVTTWPGDGVSPSQWAPLFSGKDDAKGEREIMMFSRGKRLTDGNTYYLYASLAWKDQLANVDMGCTLYFRLNSEWLMDYDELYSDMWYDIGTENQPHIPNQWDPKTEGTGSVVAFASKKGDNGLWGNYKIQLKRYTTFGFDHFQVRVMHAGEGQQEEETDGKKTVTSTEPSDAGMRELRSYRNLMGYKVGKMVRFNVERPRTKVNTANRRQENQITSKF